MCVGPERRRGFRRASRALILPLCALELSAQYAGSTACRECHSEKFAVQSASSHARALASSPPGSAGEWAFGAGDKAVTYVSRTGEDWYVEHGLSFYASTQALGPTPGHKDAADLPYPSLAPGPSMARCFRCHSTGPLTLGAGFALQPAESGVRCEACHGPGGEHVKAGGGAASIGNPARLNAVELNQFCGTCHRRPPEPSEVNDSRITVGLKFDWSNRWNTRHQPAYLSQSPCFRGSGGKLSCLTCHDPHGNAPRSQAADDRHCTQCHRQVGHLTKTSGVACVSCHMPGVPATPEMRFTNHWIGIYANGNPLMPAHGARRLPPLTLSSSAESKRGSPNDPSTLGPLFDEELSIRLKQLGRNSPKVARTAATLGSFLKETGNSAAAEAPLRQALEIDRANGASDLWATEEELAQVLQAEGKRTEAIDLFRQAAAGPDARVAARGYASLARLEPSSAAKHYASAVAAQEAASGKNDPRVATELSNLALALRASGDLKTAEALLRRALGIQERAFGRRHYQTATTISNLGAVLQGLDNLAEGERLEREALSIFEQTLPQSQETAAICANLGGLLSAKGDRAGAAEMFRRAIALDESAAGPDTLEVAADLVSLASLVDRNAAATHLRRALAIYVQRLGPNSAQARGVRQKLTSAGR